MKTNSHFSPMADKAPIAILISGRGSNMAAIIEACALPSFPAYVTRVISDRVDAAGLKRAENAGIPTNAFERRDYKSKAEHEAAILRQLDRDKPHLVCLAGFMRILSPEFIAHYPGNILNIHPSLLPKYPGLNTHARALTAGDKKHGCTVHIVSEGVDEGPVVAQASIDISPSDNEISLEEKVLKLEHPLYVDAIRKVLKKIK